MKFQVVLLSGLLIAAPAFAQEPAVSRNRGIDTTPSDTRRSGDTNENGERLVCRTGSTSSTSRMAPRRICRTAEQWRAASRADSD